MRVACWSEREVEPGEAVSGAAPPAPEWHARMSVTKNPDIDMLISILILVSLRCCTA
jgi:hypothetical protein